MKLLFDTDAFCKIGIANLLPDVAELFGATLQECRRLYALPFMMRKGSLRKMYGESACDRLLPLANLVPVMPDSSVTWLEKVAGVEVIDPGEAQVFAVAAEYAKPFLSGDKRALNGLKSIGEFVPAVGGRVVTMEAVFLALCDRIGQDEIRRRVAPLLAMDQMVAVCFSDTNPCPSVALGSYLMDLQAKLSPLQLWNPLARP